VTVLYCKTHWSQLEKKGYNFNDFKTEFLKSYDTPHEENLRQKMVEMRLKKIMLHNKNPHSTYKMGVNHLLDWTDAELKKMHGLNKGLLYHQKQDPQYNSMEMNIDAEKMKALPKNVDWREKGIVTPVKDQGRCGSCWTFASAEAIESILALANGQLVELSEQNILDCTPNPHHCGGTGGCAGGTAELAYDNLKNIGVASEWSYSYNSYWGSDFQCSKQAKPYTMISGYVTLPMNQQQPLMFAVANVGPIAISVDASAWHFYDSGVFDDCNQTNPDIDHATLLVGYGSDNALGDYWLVRNSWSPGWGEKGYIRIRRESIPRCGVDITPSDGTGCDGGPPTVTVCGTCGILFDSCYPLYNSTFPPSFF